MSRGPASSAPPGPRLIDHLRALGYTNRAARALLASGKVSYGGAPTADEGRQVDPARVVLSLNAARHRPNRDLVVLFHDRHLAVVLKPPGMLAVDAPGRRQETSVIEAVRHLLGSAFAVHRLDEPTSGLMMVALTEACQAQIKALLFRHEVEREYLAIVRGHFPAAPVRVRTKLVRDRGDGLRGSRDDSDQGQAKEAVSRFSLVERLGPRASLVAAKLETGRTHQVRIHLSERGFPVLGDPLYGPRGSEQLAPRLALHAAHLGLRHPLDGSALSFAAPLADDLEQLRRRLCRP
ncbi:MAG: RluA family pseudouridine synthase [Proteobacteria bacterium]|nr:RluA family pseudouridine synthase [Pseudomonadota bacterium]